MFGNKANYRKNYHYDDETDDAAIVIRACSLGFLGR